MSPDGRTVYVALGGSPKAPPGINESTLPPADESADVIAAIDVGLASALDVETGVVSYQLPVGQEPEGVGITPNGGFVYVTAEAMPSSTGCSRGSVFPVKGRSPWGAVVAVIPVGTRSWGVTIVDDGTKAYTANGPSNDVSVVDIATRQVIKRIPVGKVPWGVASLR